MDAREANTFLDRMCFYMKGKSPNRPSACIHSFDDLTLPKLVISTCSSRFVVEAQPKFFNFDKLLGTVTLEYMPKGLLNRDANTTKIC